MAWKGIKIIFKVLYLALRGRRFTVEVWDSIQVYHAILDQLKENKKMAKTKEEKIKALQDLKQFDSEYFSFIDEKLEELKKLG